MRLLITGICGFAGSEIVRELLAHQSGLEIFGLDNLSRRGSEGNLEPLRALGAKIEIGDVRDREALARLPGADWVIDCAANPCVLAGTAGNASSSLDLIEHNLFGTVNLLEYCREHGAGFLLLSTSRVYGVRPLAALPVVVEGRRFVLPQDGAAELPFGLTAEGIGEDFSTTPPVSLYGNTKLCSELLALEYGELFGFPVWINRCGVLAGAGQFGKADQGVFSFWLHAWASGHPLRFIGFGGRGLQVRDCLHPRDLVPVFLQQLARTEHPDGRIFNLAGGAANTMSLWELSDWCEEHLGACRGATDPREPAPPQPDRPFDLPWVVLDSARARTAWSWQPQRSLPQILEEIAAHTRSHPQWLSEVA